MGCPYYEILGISKDASTEEIRYAYFRKLREYPPNRNPEKFKEISKAYEVLSDPERRRLCDKFGNVSKLEDFMEKAKDKKIAELGVHKINIGGEELNINALTCRFCKERIANPHKKIMLEIHTEYRAYSAVLADMQVCSGCYKKFEKADRTIGKINSIWNATIALYIMVFVIFSSIGNNLSLLLLSAYSLLSGSILMAIIILIRRLKKINYFNWLNFGIIKQYIDMSIKIISEIAQLPLNYDQLASEFYFRLKNFKNLGKVKYMKPFVFSHPKWDVQYVSDKKEIYTYIFIFILISAFGALLSDALGMKSPDAFFILGFVLTPVFAIGLSNIFYSYIIEDFKKEKDFSD